MIMLPSRVSKTPNLQNKRKQKGRTTEEEYRERRKERAREKKVEKKRNRERSVLYYSILG